MRLDDALRDAITTDAEDRPAEVAADGAK